MRIAYLIFGYRNPRLIKQTIDRLTSEGVSFHIHIDQKSDLTPFLPLKSHNVHFTKKRLPVYWAEFSGVEAILLLIREALASSPRCDYLVLLSGSEFPLRNKEYIHKFFVTNCGQEFITMNTVPAPGKPLSRITTPRYPSTRPVLRFVFRVLAKAGLGQRNFEASLKGMRPYSGLTWWSLSRQACEYIIGFSEQNQAIGRFFQNVFAPEESYFHTILGNSPFHSKARRNLVFEDWSACGPRPEVINEKHVELFEQQLQVSVQDLHGPGELLFARKFSDDDLHLIPRIERMIDRKGSD